MNRRTYLKGILALGTLSAGSFFVFKWFDLHQPVNSEKWGGKRAVIAELAETIIPVTDTPGAKDAAVQDYIINVMINCTPVIQQKKFLSGIQDLEDYTLNNYDKTVLKCSIDEKLEILNHFEAHSGYSIKILNRINNKIFGKPFYFKLKDLTVEGYCLSQAGATQGLAYDYIPGNYTACIPLGRNQKSWATK